MVGMTQEASSVNPFLPYFDTQWPVMDGAAFYDLPGEVVETLDPHTEADRVAVLVTYLTTFGCAVGRGPHAVADGAEHAARLFAILVGDSSKARKGTAWTQVKHIFTVADERFVDERILGGFGSGEALIDTLGDDPNDRRLLVYAQNGRTS